MGKKVYSSLLSLDDLMTQLQGNTSTQNTFIQGVQKKRADNNKSISTFEKDFYKNKIKTSTSKKEREDFEKALQQELEIEKAFEEQEKQLELQNRISKLSPEKQSVYFLWKNKGVDKLEELEKWDTLEKSKVNAKGGSWRDKLEAASEENTAWKEAGDFSLISPKSYLKTAWGGLKEVATDIADAVVNTTFRDNLLYEKKQKESNKYFDEIVKPLMEDKLAKKRLEYQYIDLKATKFDEQNKNKNFVINPYYPLLHQTADEIKDLQDVKDRKGGWEGFYGNDIAPEGWKKLQIGLNAIKAANNKEKGKSSDVDDMWLNAYASQEENKQVYKNPNKWYNTMQGVRHSLDLSSEMLLSAGWGGVVSKVLRKGVTKGAEKYLAKELLKEVSEETLEQVAKKSLAKKGLEATLKGITGTVGMGVQSQFMTNTYTSGIEKMLGNNIQVIEDENGREQIVVGKKGKENVLKQANLDLKAIELKEQKLRESLTGDPKIDAATQAELDKIQKDKEGLYSVLNQIGTPAEDLDYGDAHTYGTIQTLGELFSERYVGRGLDAIGGSKLMNLAGKPFNKLWKSGQNLTDKVFGVEGKIAKNIHPLAAQALRHTGKSGKIINSLPSEIGEEVFVQLIPNNLDNYKEQVSQLTDPEFYKDIALQTLIMGGMFGTVGTVANAKHHSKMLFNKSYADKYSNAQDNLKTRQEFHKLLEENIDTPEYAKILAQASSKGIFSMEDRMETVLDLEKAGNKKEALHIAEQGLTNMLHEATVTGTQSEFINSLRDIVHSKSEYIPDSLKQAAQNVFAKKGKYEKILQNYGGAANFNEIYEVLSDVEDTKDLISKIEQKNVEFLPKVQASIEKLKAEGKISEDFTIEQFNFNNKQKGFNQAYFEGLQENLTTNENGEKVSTGNIVTESINQYAKDVNTIIDDLQLNQEEAAQYFENLSGIEMAQMSNYNQLKKLQKITSEKYQKEFIERNLSRQIDATETKEELKAHEDFLKVKGLLTPKLEQQIEQREEEISLNLPPQNRVEENISTPNENQSEIFNELEQNDDEINARLASTQQSQPTSQGEPEFWDFESRYNENSNVTISDKALEAGKRELEDLRDKLGRPVTFEDFINSFIESFGKDRTEKSFNKLSFLANKLGLDISIANDYHDRTFNNKQLIFDELGLDEDVETTPTPQQIVEQEKQVTQVGLQANPATINVNTTTGEVTPRTVVTNEDTNEIYEEYTIGETGSYKIDTPKGKLAFNSTSKQLPDGTWRVDLNKLETNGLDGDGLLPLDIDYMYEVHKDSLEGSVHIEFTEDPSIISKLPESLQREIAKAKTPEEKAMITPVVVIHKSKDGEFRTISFIHSYGWYKDDNTADVATKIQGNENVKQIRLALAASPTKQLKIQIDLPRGVQFNSFNKHSNGELLPVSERNKQSVVGYARHTKNTFSYQNAPEGLKLSSDGNGIAEDRARIVNIEQFESSDNKINRNNPVIFHKVGINKEGKYLYMVNTLLSPYTYTNEQRPQDKNISNFSLPENLKRTFEKALLGILLKSKSLNPNLKVAIDKKMSLSEQQNKDVQKLSSLNMLSKFIRVFLNDPASSYGNKNTSTGFKDELRKYKKEGKKNTVFREFINTESGVSTSEMAFWDNDAKDYRLVNLDTFTTRLLQDPDTAIRTVPDDFDALLDKMVNAMSVVNIFATSPTSQTNLITREGGIQTVFTSDIYKDLLLTPLVSYEMENAKGEKVEVFNVQSVIHYVPIDDKGNLTEVKPVETTLEKAQQASQQSIQEIDNKESNSQLEKLRAKREEFISSLVSKGFTEEKATELFESQLNRLNKEVNTDFESRNNINVSEVFKDKDTLKIEGLTVEEQKHLISYLKHNVLSSPGLKKLFNKNKVTSEALKEIANNIKNSLNLIEENKKNIEASEEVLQQLGLETSIANINLISKYETILDNRDKIEKTLKQEIEALDIDIENVDNVNESESKDDTTSESFDKTNGEQNTKMLFGFSLRASLYGIPKQNKSGQNIIGLLELPEYVSPDDVYTKIVEVVVNTENNLEAWKKAFLSKYESSKVNGKITHNTTIYKDIYNYLNNLPEERVNELMSTVGSLEKLTVLKQNISINQESVFLPDGTRQSFTTWVDVQVLDENSSKQQGVIKRALINNFTNSVFGTFAQIKDGKVVMNSQYISNTINKLDKLILLPDTDSKKYDFKVLREIFDNLGFYGINDNTIKYIIDTRNSNNNIDIYGEKFLLKPLLQNLKNIQNSKEDFSVFGTPEKSPYNNLVGLNTLIKKEIELNGSAIASAIRVGEKTLQGTLQGTSVYSLAKTFLNDVEREKALKEFGQDLYTKNNVLLEVIGNSQKFRENFELAFNSPEVMKIHGKNVFGNSDIDEISTSDRLAFYFNMFIKTKGEILLETDLQKELNEKYVDETQENTLNFKVGRVPSLTLSDKGRLLLIPSILVGLKAKDFNIINGRLESLSDSVLSYAYNSVFKGELNRVLESYKTNKGSNFKEYSKGNRLFSTLASLNGIKIDYTPVGETVSISTNIHDVIVQEFRNNNKELRPEVLSQIENAIKEKFENYVKHQFSEKLRETERVETDEGTVVKYDGELVQSGIVQEKVTYKNNKTVTKTVTTKEGKTAKEIVISMVNLSEIKDKEGNNEVEKLQHATLEFIINSFTSNQTNTGVFLKDPAWYHKSKVKTKLEKKGDILGFDKATIKSFDNPAKLVQLQKDIASNIQKRSALMIAPGYNIADSSNSILGDSRYSTEMIHIAVKDVEMHSMMLDGMIRNEFGNNLTKEQEKHLQDLKNINDTIEEHKKQLEKLNDTNDIQNKINQIQDLIEQARKIGIVQQSITEQIEDPKTGEITEKTTNVEVDLFESVRPYFEITGTDAQEYSTWRTHLDTLFRKGKEGITKKQFENLTHKFENNIDLTKEDLKLIFQPIKGVYTGSVFDKDIEKMRPVYIKSSVFPLLPQWVKGTPLDNVRKNLESLEQVRTNGHVDRQVRMSYQTANKIGSKNTGLTMQFLYNTTPEQFKNSTQLTSGMSILPMSGWRIQQETPSKEQKYFLKGKDSRITLGSQFFKGIMGNFINKIPRQSFNNLFTPDILKLANVELKEREKLNGDELDKIYTSVYKKYSDMQLEQLEKELNLNAINNFYAPKTTREQKLAVLKSLQKLLKKEISRKGYPTYLKDSLDLIEDELQYQSVLMFDNNRHKFEAMLQSIIANRLIIHTLPGNAHISGSSEGFMKKKHLSDLSAEDKSIMVWLNSETTGELKATYLKDNSGNDVMNNNGDKVLVEAEVALPSHFKVYNSKTEEYEYVDLTSDEYSYAVTNEKGEITGRALLRNEDGSLKGISEEMLSNFGFRIPTSSHQSGTILKIVAFLPQNAGDLILVPKEQTTQLGEDYDVDKRYMYKANYIVDENGKIRELKPEDFDLFVRQYLSKKDKTELLQNSIEEVINELKTKKRELYDQLEGEGAIKRWLENPWDGSFEQEQETIEKQLKDIKAEIHFKNKIQEKLKSEFEVKLLENAMINTYKSVYTSSDLEVQKKIYKPLITDVAEKSAKAIDAAYNSGEVSENFSMFSDAYQRYLMQLGADGKGGIGVHSNGVVLLAQLQRLPDDKKIQLGWFKSSWRDTNGVYYPAEFKPFEVLFNNSFIKNSFYGTLGKSKMTLDGKREVAEQPGENQNVSTDNVNKGIMVLRNENSHTLDIYNMLALMGIDQSNDELTTIDGNRLNAHVPGFLVSQPIMKKYVELKEKYKKLNAEFKTQQDINTEIEEELFKEFIGVGPTSFKHYNDVLNSSQFNSQLLYDMIQKPEFAKSSERIGKYSNGEVQWAIFEMLMDVKEQSDKINKVRKLANLSTSKLGISYFETIDKMNILTELIRELEQADIAMDLGEITSYNNWLNLLGEVKYNNLMPTTIEGVQLINALDISNKLMPVLFNYSNNNLLNGGIVDKIFEIEEREITATSASAIREKYQIMSEFTNFVNSGMGAFDGSTNSELIRLTKTTDFNKSLGYILQDLIQKRHPIMQNHLLKDLQIVTNAKTSVSIIKHTAQDVGTLEDNNKINAFLDLLKDDTVLGKYNNEDLTVSNLAKDLISYAVLADNQNGATGYRQFIPVSYLETVGFSSNVRNFNDRLQKEYIVDVQERFVQQYFQHNPDKIKYKESYKGKPVIPESGRIPKYALVRLSGSKKQVFKWNNSTKSYEQIPVLGSKNNIDEAGINEYDFNNAVHKTVFQEENQKIIYHEGQKANAQLSDLNFTGQLNKLFSKEEMLTGDANAILTIMDRLFANRNMDKYNPGYREIWELYRNYLDKDVKIKFEIPQGKSIEKFEGLYRYNENTIYINPNIFTVLFNRFKEKSPSTSVNINELFIDFRRVMMEEILHSIQVSHLHKGFNTPQGKSIREYHKKALQLGINNLALQNTGDELVDVAEFIAGIYHDPTLREQLEKADKGFIDRLLNAIKRLMQEMIPGEGFDKIHHDMMELIKQNTGKVNFLVSQIQTEQEQTRELTPAEKLNEIRKNDVNIKGQYTQDEIRPNKDFESRDNLTNFAEEAFKCK